MPSDVWPDPTAIRACSIWTSLPEGLLRHKTEMGSEISDGDGGLGATESVEKYVCIGEGYGRVRT